MSATYLIASGKGGVGKSTLTAALGYALAGMGHSVVIVDADLGLRAQDALLMLENQVVYDIVDVVNGDCLLDQALLTAPEYPGLSLLPASQFARAKALDAKSLRRIIRSLRASFDLILIDCPAGIERGFRNVMNTAICQAILVSTPDDICMRDVERVAALLMESGVEHPWLIVNRLNGDLIARQEMYSAQVVSDTLDLPLLGEVPEDPLVYRALLRHIPLMTVDCPARQAVIRIASRLQGQSVPFPEIGSRRMSWLDRLRSFRIKEVPSLRDH